MRYVNQEGTINVNSFNENPPVAEIWKTCKSFEGADRIAALSSMIGEQTANKINESFKDYKARDRSPLYNLWLSYDKRIVRAVH